MITRSLAVALVLAIGGAALQSWRLHNLQAATAQADHDRAEQTREAERMAGRRLETIAHDTHAQLARAQADAAAARGALDRLRIAATAAGAASVAGPAAASAPAAGPGLVLADVLSGAAGRAAELAAALDDARAAGIACERSYDALSRLQP